LAVYVVNDHRELVEEAPRPRFARLERADDWMAARLGVSAGVTTGRAIAAGHLAALQADAKMQPSASCGQALLAALDRLGELRDLNVIQMRAGGHAFTLGKERLDLSRELGPVLEEEAVPASGTPFGASTVRLGVVSCDSVASMVVSDGLLS
jgi:hypothetical protein